MKPEDVTDRSSLEAFLAGDWMHISRTIAFRAALRNLPNIPTYKSTALASEALVIFRALLITSLKLDDYYQNIAGAVEAALGDIGHPKFEQSEQLFGSARACAAEALASVVLNDAPEFWAARAVSHNVGFYGDGVWKFVQNELETLQSLNIETTVAEASQVMLNRPIWPFGRDIYWESLWTKVPPHLNRIDSNFCVWIDWYERRIRGERAAFDIPSDKRRVEDKKILRRLAEATDEDFWGKGHEYVNATLKGWLDEARARVAPPPIIGDASGALEISGTATGEMGPLPPEVPAKLPSQNTNAISFRTDNDGRIAINADALTDRLRADAGARDRHEEAVNEARNALNRCHGNNAAARLTGLLTNYLLAAGENLEAAKPSLLVQRGERLRQELARYEAPDHMLPPVADDLLLDLKGWLTAHNMVVGLDPVLNAMDTAMLGPDRQPALIPPDEIREKARAAEEADLLQDGVIEVVEEAADLAPAVPDANDRHTIWSTEMVRNLMIETASVALNNPAATGTVVAVGAVLSSGLAVGIAGGVSIMGSIKAAEYLVTHKEWVLARLGNTPTWQALIAKLADWLEKMTPFEPK